MHTVPDDVLHGTLAGFLDPIDVAQLLKCGLAFEPARSAHPHADIALAIASLPSMRCLHWSCASSGDRCECGSVMCFWGGRDWCACCGVMVCELETVHRGRADCRHAFCRKCSACGKCPGCTASSRCASCTSLIADGCGCGIRTMISPRGCADCDLYCVDCCGGAEPCDTCAKPICSECQLQNGPACFACVRAKRKGRKRKRERKAGQ